MMLTVAERKLFIWKLEWWWIAFNDPMFYPKERMHLFGGLFWRLKSQELKLKE